MRTLLVLSSLRLSHVRAHRVLPQVHVEPICEAGSRGSMTPLQLGSAVHGGGGPAPPCAGPGTDRQADRETHGLSRPRTIVVVPLGVHGPSTRVYFTSALGKIYFGYPQTHGPPDPNPEPPSVHWDWRPGSHA